MRRRRIRLWGLAAALLCAPAAAFAHRGHHDGGAEGLRHTLTQPDHLLTLGAAGAAALLVPLGYWYWTSRAATRRAAGERVTRANRDG